MSKSEQQHANTPRLFIKLCWLMETHAVSADRVVNIDIKQAQLQGNTKEATARSQSPSAWIVARWTCWRRSFTRTRQTPSCRSTRHARELVGNHDDAPATHGRPGRRDEPRQGRTIVVCSLGHGQLPTFPEVVLCFNKPHSISYLQPWDVAVFRGFKSCIQTQASTTLARSVIDSSFDDVVMNKALRRQCDGSH